MDVSGFTKLSSKLGSTELVECIDALFSSVDYAAECIGGAWMVELIGQYLCCLPRGIALRPSEQAPQTLTFSGGARR